MHKGPSDSTGDQESQGLCGTLFLDGERQRAKEPPSLDEFLLFTTRRQRYRMAGKTLRFEVYRSMENYLLASVALALLQVWLSLPWMVLAVTVNTWLIAVVGLAHHGKLLMQRPWLAMAAAFEGWAVWAVFAWGLSRFFTLPYLGTFCVFLAIWRYWDRGEDVVNELAYKAAGSIDYAP